MTLIEKLYGTFSIYKPARKLTGCYCDLCLSEEYSDYLANTPLQELQPDDFIGYLQSVDILLNDCRDFKYFLPRLLELELSSEDNSSLFFDQVWTVLGRSDHANWPIIEQSILKDLSLAYQDKARRNKLGDGLKVAHLDLAEARLDLNNTELP